MAVFVPLCCEPPAAPRPANWQPFPGAIGMGYVLLRRSGQQAEIGATRCLPALDQLEPGSRQHPANSETQTVDFFTKRGGADGAGQESLDEFEKDSDVRR